MRLKYYLRGLGIGIVVTAMIMGVSANGKTESLTDAQIIARAKELGMVDGVLSELPEADTDGTEASDTEEISSEESEGDNDVTGENIVPKEAEGAESDTDLEHVEAGEEPEVQEGAENPEGDELDVAGEAEGDVTIYTVAVYPGEGSYTVSRKLAALGLVESANLFDDFLCQNGYDKKLCTGNYRVKEGANAEEIAKVLTGQLVY